MVTSPRSSGFASNVEIESDSGKHWGGGSEFVLLLIFHRLYIYIYIFFVLNKFILVKYTKIRIEGNL